MKSRKTTLVSINKLFNRRNDAIKFVDNYGSMILGAKKKRLKKQNHQKTKLKNSSLEFPEKI